jgi:hypothetical protein
MPYNIKLATRFVPYSNGYLFGEATPLQKEDYNPYRVAVRPTVIDLNGRYEQIEEPSVAFQGDGIGDVPNGAWVTADGAVYTGDDGIWVEPS